MDELNEEYGSELICPYCKAENHVEAEDYGNEGDTEERECCECEKTFTYEISYSINFTSKEAPCLNGADHEFKEARRHPRLIGGKVLWRCDICTREEDRLPEPKPPSEG